METNFDEQISVKAEKKMGAAGYSNEKTPNALYKNYKTYMENQGKKPVAFAEWIKWAKEKGIVKNDFKAEGEEIRVEEIIQNNTRKTIGIVVISVMVIYLGYKAYNYFSNNNGNV